VAKTSPDSWGFSVTTNLKDTGVWPLPQGQGQSSDDTTAPCWSRSPAELIDGSPLGPSPDKETSARALTTTEVETFHDDTYMMVDRWKNALG